MVGDFLKRREIRVEIGTYVAVVLSAIAVWFTFHTKPYTISRTLVGIIIMLCITSYLFVHHFVLRNIYRAKAREQAQELSDEILRASAPDQETATWCSKLSDLITILKSVLDTDDRASFHSTFSREKLSKEEPLAEFLILEKWFLNYQKRFRDIRHPQILSEELGLIISFTGEAYRKCRIQRNELTISKALKEAERNYDHIIRLLNDFFAEERTKQLNVRRYRFATTGELQTLIEAKRQQVIESLQKKLDKRMGVEDVRLGE